jgi:hypothetical protein
VFAERGARPVFAGRVVGSLRVIALRFVCSSVVLAALVAACSETDCDLAEDRIEDCGVDNAALTGSGLECGPRAACEAECLLGASCAEIVGVLSRGEANELSACVVACVNPSTDPA